MEWAPKDVWKYCIFKYFDGKTAAIVCKVCKSFREWILENKLLCRKMALHLVEIDSPYEFLNAIGNPVYGGRPGTDLFLVQEGSRNFWNKKTGKIIEFNDFYSHGPIAFPKVEDFLIIKYPPLYGVERFNLGEGFGTIHRGTSIVIFY